MGTDKISSERGQSLVMVALMIIAFAAILALVLDGGGAYAARRKAQNAADAGALAGAQYMCTRLGEADIAYAAGNVATDYAITKNGADAAVATVDVTVKTITVTASVRQEAVFFRLLGPEVITPTAIAAARCMTTGGAGVLPIAWACRPPITGVTPEEFDCAEYADPDYEYLIMDSESLNEDFYCQDPPNSGLPDADALDCDMDNDNVNEILAGGDRSWVDLDGTILDSGSQGADELTSWINGSQIPPDILPHTWLPDQSGVATSIFQNVGDYLLGKDVLIPVFNKYCDGDPRYTAGCLWDTGEDDIKEMGGSPLYFHIIGFATFHITCVHAGPYKNCPVQQAALNEGIIPNPSTKTIEGYFRRGHYASHGTGSNEQPWTGAFVVRLIR